MELVEIAYDYAQPEYEKSIGKVKSEYKFAGRDVIDVELYDGKIKRYDIQCVSYLKDTTIKDAIPPLPDEPLHKCYCATNVVVHYGCRCGGL